MAKKKNPCKFILLKTGEELNYDQARDFLFKNYDFENKTLIFTQSKEYEKGAIRSERGGDRGERYSSGNLAPLDGAPTKAADVAGPDPKLVAVAEEYARKNGIPLRRQAIYVKVNPGFAKRLAIAYEQMKHDPQNPKVKEAYDDLIRQTKAQYEALVDAGYEFTFFDRDTDPYQGNPLNAMRDLRKNKKMAVYGTYDGYGTEAITESDIANNPMLQDTGLKWKDQNGVERPVTANDLFRAVHDAFGHGLEGAGFRARGEENAWQAHVRLFTGPAIAAITSETRGQNSFLNFGPNGEINRNAKIDDTIFAPQKTGLMPEWTWTSGRVGDFETGTEVTAKKGKVEEKIENITDGNVEQIGKTILAYHATPTGEVKSGKEAGIHIGTEKAAEQVKEARNLGEGQVVPVTVKINKPLVLSDMPTWSSNNLLAQLYNPSEGKYFGLSREQIRQVRDSDMTEKQKQQWVIDYLKKQGYDSIAYKNEAEDPGKYSYVVFDEKQITPTEYEKATKEPAMLEGVRDGRPEEKGREARPELRAEEEAKREEEVRAEEKSVDERIKEAKKNLADLFSQTTRMGFAFDPKKQAEVQYNIHKTLVNLAKLYIEKGINTVADFANSLKLKVQDVQRAWDEANGGKVITEKMLEKEPYDQDSIRKAILSDQINYAQTQSEQAAEQAINNGNTAFDNFDSAMTGDAVYDLMTPSQKRDFYNEQIAAFNTKEAIKQSQQTPPSPIAPATWWQRFKIRYINPQSRIQDIQQEFKGRGMDIMREANAALKYELMIGKAQSKIEDIMNTVKDIYSRLKKDGGNVEELGLYMYALHAKERNENVAKERMEEFNEERKRLEDIISDSASTDREIANARKDLDDLVKGKGKVKLLPDGGSGMMNQTADEIIKAVEDSGKKDLYDQYAKEFREKIIIPNVEQMLSYGLIDKDQANQLLTQYQNYVPLQVVEKQRKGPITRVRGAGVRGRDVFKARGSALYNYTERYNPIFSSVWNFNNTITRGEANVAAKALLELAKLDKDGLVFEVGKPKYSPIYDSNGDVKGMIPFPSTFTADNSVMLKVDGKPVFVKIKDIELLNAMKKNGVMRGIRGLAIINGWIRNTATLANPEFIVSNFIRDYETTLFNLLSVKRDYKDIDLKGLTKEIANPKNVYKAGKAIIADHKGDNSGEWGKYAKMYREYGGRTSWFLNESLDDFNKKMEKDVEQMGKGGPLGVRALNYLGEKMYRAQLAAEQSMRLSTFKALVEKGVNPEDAASAAKNITVNFENKGTIMEFIDSLYLFASAQIKGTYRVTKTLVTSKKGQAFAAGLVAYGILESYLNDMLGGEEDEEDRINEGDKERSFIIMHPKDPKADPIKIPLFYGMNVFKYAGNVAYDVYAGKKSALDGSLTVLKSIYNQVSPFQGPTLSQSLAPTAFDPFIQHSENKSYRDAPLKPEQPKFGPRKKESELYFKSARPFSVAASKYLSELTGGGIKERGAIDVSPELIDHYYDALTGGAGRFVANSAQTVVIASQKAKAYFEKEDAPPMELKNIPFVRLFRGGAKDKEYMRTVYDVWTVSGVDKLTPTQMERFDTAINKALKENVIDEKDANRLREDVEKGQKLIINDDFIRQHYDVLNNYIKQNNFAPLTPEQQKIVDKSIEENALSDDPNSIEGQVEIIIDEIQPKNK